MSDATHIRDILQKRHDLLKNTRAFFYDRGYIEIETANLMKTPAPDPNIEPLQVFIGGVGPYFLHTSPEIGMKKLLAAGIKKAFQICKVYRIEDHQEIHSTEFSMLEWYREGTYQDTMAETNELVSLLAQVLLGKDSKPFQKTFECFDLRTLFMEKTRIDPFGLTRTELVDQILENGFSGVDAEDTVETLFFKLFLQEIEPALPKQSPYFLMGWPAFISTMAKNRNENPNQVERFELYIGSLEIANGYTELINADEQRKRFINDNNLRKSRGDRTFDIDEDFLKALDQLRYSYTGVSVGLDRLLMALLEKDTIGAVIPGRFKV